jgi:hypothetical protein
VAVKLSIRIRATDKGNFHCDAESDAFVFGATGRITEMARGGIMKFFEK